MNCKTKTIQDGAEWKKKTIMTLLISLISNFFVNLALILVFSLVLLKMGITSENLVMTLTTISLAAGCFFGGIVAAKFFKSKGLFLGAFSGFLFFLFLTILSMIIGGKGLDGTTFVRLIVALAFGGFGGVLGLKKHKKNTPRKR